MSELEALSGTQQVVHSKLFRGIYIMQRQSGGEKIARRRRRPFRAVSNYSGIVRTKVGFVRKGLAHPHT